MKTLHSLMLRFFSQCRLFRWRTNGMLHSALGCLVNKLKRDLMLWDRQSEMVKSTFGAKITEFPQHFPFLLYIVLCCLLLLTLRDWDRAGGMQMK